MELSKIRVSRMKFGNYGVCRRQFGNLYTNFTGDFRCPNADYSFHGGKLLWSLVQITN